MNLKCDISGLFIRNDNKENLLLKEVHFELNENKIYTIIGKNGSGKTTLIKSLSRLLDKRYYKIEGDISADGKSILRMNTEELLEFRKNKIKYVLQDAINSFDPLRILEYYLKKFNASKDETEDLLSYFLLPSYDKIKSMYPWQLSGGMIQRFSMVFSLLLHSELLILDEPTSGLDAPVSNLILLKLKEFVNEPKKSVLIITQDMTFAEAVSDFIAHIENKTLTTFISAVEYLSSENRMFTN